MFDDKTTKIRQGSVINKLHTPIGETSGIVITARCDIAQEKIDTITILPIEPITTWITRVGKFLFIGMTKKDVIEEMSKLMEKHDLPKDSYKEFSLESILSAIEAKAKKEEIRELSLKINEYKTYTESPFKSKLKPLAKKKEELIKNLIQHGIYGAYYIDKIPGLNTPHVIDMRSPFSIPYEFIKKIEKPLDLPRYNRHIEFLQTISPPPKPNEYIKSIATLKSPFIEHLLQRFCLTFSRIGLPDSPKDTYKKLLGIYENV